jgi:large subunit ribosomal protein L4
MEQDILNRSGKVVGQVKLNQKIFDGRINMSLLYQVINSYLANKASLRKASTKTRGQVSGSGRKPWRQKGTGRARVGELRNPLWRKGGVVFGPKVRNAYKKIPPKMRLAALKSALNSKYNDKELLVLDKLEVKAAKTKEFFQMVKNLKLKKRSLFVDKEFNRECLLSSRNINTVALARASDLNAYLALNCKDLVVTKEALSILENRILGGHKSQVTSHKSQVIRHRSHEGKEENEGER